MILHGVDVSLFMILQVIVTPKYKQNARFGLCASFATLNELHARLLTFLQKEEIGYHVRNFLS